MQRVEVSGVEKCLKIENLQIIKEMSKKIALIQNPGLGEFKIRDMNDDINRLIRLKNAWEHRIKTIGGPDYRFFFFFFFLNQILIC